MSLLVREMAIDEVDLIIDYFHGSTPEHLDLLGVDPRRLPAREHWRAWYTAEYERPVEERSTVLVIWELDGAPVGFSTADKITFGAEAYMHLHVMDPDKRRSGIGTRCVRDTVGLLQTAGAQATVLLSQRLQPGTEQNTSSRGLQVPEDTHDRPGANQLPPGGHRVGA
ncbi:MAG: GNAT family N-acetyltransferase [Gaiellaceae bacterium]